MASNDSEKKVVGDVDERIVERLGEHARKMRLMRGWERKRGRNGIARYAFMAVAASVAVLLVTTFFWGGNGNVIDELGIEAPQMEAYRSAMPQLTEIDNLINNGKYYEAVDAAEKALENSNWLIEQMEMFPMEDDEEWEYQYHAEKSLNSEIRWVYIYALIMVESEKLAVKELKKYLKDEEFCKHKEDAELMLKALS